MRTADTLFVSSNCSSDMRTSSPFTKKSNAWGGSASTSHCQCARRGKSFCA